MKGRIKDPRIFVKYLDVAEVPDIVKIAKECGVDVYQAPMTDAVYAGYGKRNGFFEIFVNINLKFTFQRFLVAYLLSYINLYGDKQPDYVVFNETMHDRVAYLKTLDLLMPDVSFSSNFLRGLNADKVLYLANKYKIPESLIYEKKKKVEEKGKLKILKFKED